MATYPVNIMAGNIKENIAQNFYLTCCWVMVLHHFLRDKVLFDNDGKPFVYGLKTCKKFRTTIPKESATIGVAGMF